MRTVRKLYTAMMMLLAKATDRELARMVSYLKGENRILRARLSEHINTTPRERERLLRFGRNLGQAIYSVVTIVSPGTGPKRGAGTWDEFLIRHAATLVQCDFLSKRIWTAQGLRDVFVLVF